MAGLRELCPKWVDDRRVVTSLPMPRFPDAPAIQNETTVSDFYKDRLITAFESPAGESLGLVDKLFPHSRYDAMILAAEDDVRSSVAALHDDTLRMVLDLIVRFADYVSSQPVMEEFDLKGAQLHACFNHSPDTRDRQNSQFYDKRFHLHLNCYPAQDVQGLRTVRLGEVGEPRVHRRIVDPVAYLAARLISEAAGGQILGRPLRVPSPDDSLDEPFGLQVEVGSWSALRADDFPAFLKELHETTARTYAAVRRCFVGDAGPAAPWQRPQLLPLKEIRRRLAALEWVSERSAELLDLLAQTLRDVSSEDLARMAAGAEADSLELSLNGLDYSVGFVSRGVNGQAVPLNEVSDLRLVMQCRLFGDVGGAGLPPLAGHAAVRLDRRGGPVLSSLDVARRRSFSAGFVASLTDILTRAPINKETRP